MYFHADFCIPRKWGYHSNLENTCIFLKWFIIKNIVDPFLQIIFLNIYFCSFACKLYMHRKHACFKKFTDMHLQLTMIP